MLPKLDPTAKAFALTTAAVTIPDAADDDGAPGHVVLCNRAHQQTTSIFDRADHKNETISSFIETRSANSFQWIDLNLGSDTHTFVVWATLTKTVTNHGPGS